MRDGRWEKLLTTVLLMVVMILIVFVMGIYIVENMVTNIDAWKIGLYILLGIILLCAIIGIVALLIFSFKD